MSAPASCVRISGNAPATTIWSANWPRRSTPFSREAAMGLAIIVMFLVFAGGGGYFAYASVTDRSAKRVTAIAKPQATGRGGKIPVDAALKRKNVQALLKEIETKSADAKKKVTLRQRLQQAGFSSATTRQFWIVSGSAAGIAAFMCLVTGQSLIVTALAAFVIGLGLPRWVLN